MKKGQPGIFLSGKNLTVTQATFTTVWIRTCFWKQLLCMTFSFEKVVEFFP